MSSTLDQALNFMFSRKQAAMTTKVYVPISELRQPVMHLGGKQFDTDLFRRILFVAPHLYEYRWARTQKSSSFGWELEISKNS